MQKIFLVLMIAATFIGCSSTKYVYRQIQQNKDSYNTHTFTATAVQLQKALTKMLLSKQFAIDKEDTLAGTIIASRYFSQSRNNIVVVLQARIFSQDEGHQQLFLNGIQTTQRNYVVDRTRFLLWLIPLPGGGGKEVTKTKESEASIEDKSFYADLFDAIQKDLK